MDWQEAPDIKREIVQIIDLLKIEYLRPERIFCFRSFGSKSRAMARIWSLPRIWQKALKIEPAYCIEILSEKFDHLSIDNRRKILIHEIVHIPKNFSGALLPHLRRNRGLIEELYQKLKIKD